ncbi:MAG: 3-hydroxyacyl-CoA dehydrogenase [Rhodobacteraceae bacterium]|nr:3-hydroxyacyl-CoA dehydrogenase [Paracoccaceae bacterium]
MTRSIDRIAVVSTGVIGAGWAVQFLAQGFDVVATDPAEGAEARLNAFVERNWPTVQKLGLKPGASPDRLSFTPDLGAAVAEADFIQENAPEKLDLKHSLFAKIEAAAPADAIIASSSSGLMVSDMQRGARRPERFVLGHPFNPPYLIPLVEVGGGEETSPSAVDDAMDCYARAGKKPIRINQEVKGHIANRLQVALWREAISLVEKGVASVADIDTAISHGPGLRWSLLGPFLNLHASGGAGGVSQVLKHLGPAQREWARDLGEYPETDDYIAPISAGVEAELDGHDFKETIAARDELLVNLLLAKRREENLP